MYTSVSNRQARGSDKLAAFLQAGEAIADTLYSRFIVGLTETSAKAVDASLSLSASRDTPIGFYICKQVTGEAHRGKVVQNLAMLLMEQFGISDSVRVRRFD
jgi:hypothetical protein